MSLSTAINRVVTDDCGKFTFRLGGGRGRGNFLPTEVFKNGEQGIWLDPSDFSTMFQDGYAQLPVTGVGQAISWGFDKSQGLALGSEVRQTGVIGIFGTATPATYNNVTGAGTFSRVDIANQSFVEWTGLVNTIYKVDVQNTGAFAFSVRTNNASDVVAIVNPGQRVTLNIPAQLAGISLRGNNGESCAFVMHSMKQLLGNHARQSTAASRPILGRSPASGQRNLITYTEDLANAAWMKGVAAPGVVPIVTPNFAVAPDGTNTATRLQLDGGAAGGVGNSQVANQHPIWQNTVVASVWMRSLAGNVLVTILLGGNTTNVTVTDTWQRITVVRNNPTQGSNEFRIAKRDVWGSPGAADLLVWHPQVEHGAIPTDYQKVTAAWDITEAGQPDCYYLSFDGVDDFLVTGTITPGTDKVQAVVGQRKLSDASVAVVIETGPTSSVNNFTLHAPRTAGVGNYGFIFRSDTGGANDVNSASHVAPETAVVTGVSDLSGDLSLIRVNGLEENRKTYDHGVGSFAGHPLYIGRRAGSANAFNGRIYSLIVRFGANLLPDQVYALESYVNSKTKAIPALPAPPTVSLSGTISQTEGNSGTKAFTYTIIRSISVGAVSVPWSFAVGNTSANDFAGGVYPAGGVVTIADGATSGTFTINVNGDSTIEPDEMFSVSIAAPAFYAAGSVMSATGTILNDDVVVPPPVAPNYINTAVAPYMLFGAQRVMAGYSGPLYRIRRDSDNAEMDVYCQIAGDYPNYDEVNAWAGSAGLWVATVYDQTGNGRHIVNTILANQPRLDTSIKVAGCVPIVFDGYGRSNSGGLPQAQVAKSLTVGGLVGLVRNNMSYLMASQSQVSYNSTRYIAFRPEDNSVDTSGIELQSGLLNGQRIGGLSSLDTWGAALEASNRRYFSMQGNANQAATNPADVLQRMTIGDKVGAIAFAGMYRMFALAVYNTALTATDGANTQQSLNNAFSVPAAAPYRVVFDGSSGMEGSGSTMLRNVVAQLSLTKRPEMFNMGVHGQSLASIYSGRVARFSGRYTSSRPCVFFEQGGANDLLGSDTPATTLYNNTTTPLVSYLKGLGYKVVLCTIPPIGTSHSLYTTARENERLAYNDLIRANSAGADGVCDWASDPVMGGASSPDNLTYYTGDKQHPTSEGYARYAMLVRNSLETILRTTALGPDYVP